MPIECPRCGSRYLRESQPRDFNERMGKWRFVSPMRCMDCKTRFIGKTLIFSDMLYARCPACIRMDLAEWRGITFEPPFWTTLKLTLGAHRWRCEYCRINFASFRKRREVFTFGRWQKLNSGQAVVEGRARLLQLEQKADAIRQAAAEQRRLQARQALLEQEGEDE